MLPSRSSRSTSASRPFLQIPLRRRLRSLRRRPVSPSSRTAIVPGTVLTSHLFASLCAAPAGPSAEDIARQRKLALIAQYGMVEDGHGGYDIEGGPGPGDEGYVGGKGKGPDLDGVSVDMLEAELRRMGLKKKQKKASRTMRFSGKSQDYPANHVVLNTLAPTEAEGGGW
jgi:hypothetical protein